jgi:hypothetical protein
MFAGIAVQLPVVPTRRRETIARPETSGGLNGVGICVGSAGTTSEVAETIVVVPELVAAVKATRRRFPTSSATTS